MEYIGKGVLLSMGFITGFRNKYASDEPQREEPVADTLLMMDKSSMCRHFIITKRQKPLKFSDISIKSLDYDYVDTEAAATIFGSMTETCLLYTSPSPRDTR